MHAQTVQYMKPMFRKLKHKVGGGCLELKKRFSQMPNIIFLCNSFGQFNFLVLFDHFLLG